MLRHNPCNTSDYWVNYCKAWNFQEICVRKDSYPLRCHAISWKWLYWTKSMPTAHRKRKSNSYMENHWGALIGTAYAYCMMHMLRSEHIFATSCLSWDPDRGSCHAFCREILWNARSSSHVVVRSGGIMDPPISFFCNRIRRDTRFCVKFCRVVRRDNTSFSGIHQHV